MKYSILFIAFAVSMLAVASCDKKEDPKNESENITRVIIQFNAAGLDEAFEAVDNNGDGAWDSVDKIVLPSLTGDIEGHIQVFNGATDLTPEISAENTEHLFWFKPLGADLAIKPNDSDTNGKAFNLKTLWDTGDASNGSVRITLHHTPNDKMGSEPGGEIDLDVTFGIEIQ